MLLIWLLSAVITAIIASERGDGVIVGLLIGLLFGPFGVLFALLSSGDRRPCPFCREKIKPGAAVCPHCRSALT